MSANFLARSKTISWVQEVRLDRRLPFWVHGEPAARLPQTKRPMCSPRQTKVVSPSECHHSAAMSNMKEDKQEDSLRLLARLQKFPMNLCGQHMSICHGGKSMSQKVKLLEHHTKNWKAPARELARLRSHPIQSPQSSHNSTTGATMFSSRVKKLRGFLLFRTSCMVKWHPDGSFAAWTASVVHPTASVESCSPWSGFFSRNRTSPRVPNRARDRKTLQEAAPVGCSASNSRQPEGVRTGMISLQIGRLGCRQGIRRHRTVAMDSTSGIRSTSGCTERSTSS